MRARFARFAVPALVALGLAACTATPSSSVAGASPYPPPPPVRTEVIPKPPVSETPLIWQPGHWDWAGTGYTWREGEWVQRAGHGTEWQDGYWSRETGTWAWKPAHWM